MGRGKFKSRSKRLICEVVFFGAIERPYIKLGQLSFGTGRCVSPASVTCACSGGNPIHRSVVPKIREIESLSRCLQSHYIFPS